MGRYCSVGLCLFAVSLAGRGWGADAPSKEQVRSIYQDKFSLLQTYAIRYTEVRSDFDARTGDLAAERTVTTEVLGKGIKFCVTRSLFDQVTGEVLYPERTVSNGTIEKVLASQGGLSNATATGEGILRRASSMSQMAALGNTILGHLLLQNLHLSQGRITLSAGRVDMTVLLALEDSAILPDIVEMNGHECYVVTWGDSERPRARFYLSRDAGLAVCGYDTYRPSGEPSKSIRFRDFYEVESGLFVPRAGTYLSYGPNGLLRIREDWSEVSLDVNPSLSDDMFDIQFPPGTHVTDEITGP